MTTHERWTDAELVERSELIVVGEWTGQSPVALPGLPEVRALAAVAIGEVLRGRARQTLAFVVVPPSDAPRTPESITFRQGDRGLWLLRDWSPGVPTGLYAADHPQRFVPLHTDPARMKLLRALAGKP